MQNFKVVCVAMHSGVSGTRWMLADEEIIFDETNETVKFAGSEMKHRVCGTGAGLNSMSHMITICPRFREMESWDLFTEKPAEGSNATPEDIVRCAAGIVEKHKKGGD